MIRQGLEAFDDLLANAFLPNEVGAAIESAMQKAAIIARAGVLEHFAKSEAPDGTPWAPIKFRPGRRSGYRPLRDTGRLMASVQSRAEGNVVAVGTSRIGAAVHQYGATIVPVNVSYLTIPATLQAKRAGGARNFPGELRPIINREKQKGVLVDEKGKVQYYLTKQVVIPARPFIGFSQETQELIMKMVAEKILRRALF